MKTEYTEHVFATVLHWQCVDIFLQMFFSKLVFRIASEMKNQMSALVVIVALLVSAEGEIRDDSFISFIWCCLPTCDSSHLSLSGAVKLKYAQLGGSVTLDPPDVRNPGQRYFTWYFRGAEIAWCNPYGPLPTNGNHLVSIVATGNKQLSNVKWTSSRIWTCKFHILPCRCEFLNVRREAHHHKCQRETFWNVHLHSRKHHRQDRVQNSSTLW